MTPLATLSSRSEVVLKAPIRAPSVVSRACFGLARCRIGRLRRSCGVALGRLWRGVMRGRGGSRVRRTPHRGRCRRVRVAGGRVVRERPRPSGVALEVHLASQRLMIAVVGGTRPNVFAERFSRERSGLRAEPVVEAAGAICSAGRCTSWLRATRASRCTSTTEWRSWPS